ncbi:hypothetical protein [Streptomyces sp. A1547]|uniref:hypothetical protein n=1 Tax=Streptomyces sp. A1547 TaxID=2563105 RepID=UPI00109EA8D5|nr:hypothetical protein [Streptomyces sp. A1547]THA28469.1 hypothetical protein E6W17_40985 [Streptomyces sp. A1547]
MSLEPYDMALLTERQRQFLPDPLPSGARAVFCTGCADVRVEWPGQPYDPWLKHFDAECTANPPPDDEDDD